MTLPELVIFDFAGTCLRDDGAVLAAYRQALSSHDIPFSEADLAARRGAVKRAVFRELAGRPVPSPASDERAALGWSLPDPALHAPSVERRKTARD